MAASSRRAPSPEASTAKDAVTRTKQATHHSCTKERQVGAFNRTVQEQHGRVLEHRARNRKPLLLATGQRDAAALAEQRRKPVRLLLNEGARICNVARVLHLLHCGAGLAELDVLEDGAVEECRLLAHKPHL